MGLKHFAWRCFTSSEASHARRRTMKTMNLDSQHFLSSSLPFSLSFSDSPDRSPKLVGYHD